MERHKRSLRSIWRWGRLALPLAVLALVAFALASVEVTKASGISHCFTSVLSLQFAKDIFYVCLDGVFRDRQSVRDLCIG